MKANRFRLDPTYEQAIILHRIGDRVSALWNAANYTCRQAFLAGDKVPSYASLCRAFRDHAAYRAVPSDIAQEVLKDWRYWSRKIARHQQELAVRGKKTSRRLKRFYATRRARLAHAWDGLARHIALLCRHFRVGRVVIGWPKGILQDRDLSHTWNGISHGFWSFEQLSQRLILALRRVGIVSERIGERGTSSQCPQCASRRVRRAPRSVLHCRSCKMSLHSDQAGSRNMVRQKYPVYWDGAEAAPTPDTRRFNRHLWVDAYNPAARAADLAA